MSRCNCENSHCKHIPSECPTPVGKAKVMYVGKICDDCSLGLSEWLLIDTSGNLTEEGKKEHARSKCLCLGWDSKEFMRLHKEGCPLH